MSNELKHCSRFLHPEQAGAGRWVCVTILRRAWERGRPRPPRPARYPPRLRASGCRLTGSGVHLRQPLAGGDDPVGEWVRMERSHDCRSADFNPPLWLLSASATNMAYMLSAQLAAMNLNVARGYVNGSALIYAPGTHSANALGFATVSAITAEANTSLCANPNTIASGATRTYQQALQNALNNANNNLNFVQGSPCSFTFP